VAKPVETMIRKLQGPADKVGGKEERMPLDEASELVAAGAAKFAVKRVIITGNVTPFNVGEVAGFPFHDAVMVVRNGGARPHPEDAASMGFAIPVKVPEVDEIMERGGSKVLAEFIHGKILEVSRMSARGAKQSEVDHLLESIATEHAVGIAAEKKRAADEKAREKQLAKRMKAEKAAAEKAAAEKAEKGPESDGDATTEGGGSGDAKEANGEPVKGEEKAEKGRARKR
jgi:hypothetical protein